MPNAVAGCSIGFKSLALRPRFGLFYRIEIFGFKIVVVITSTVLGSSIYLTGITTDSYDGYFSFLVTTTNGCFNFFYSISGSLLGVKTFFIALLFERIGTFSGSFSLFVCFDF